MRPAWVRKDYRGRWWPNLPSSNSGLSAAALGTAWFGVCVRAGLEPADRDDLVPGSDLDGEGREAEAQDSIGAVKGLLQGWMTPPLRIEKRRSRSVCVCVCTVGAVQPDLGSPLWTSSKDSG